MPGGSGLSDPTGTLAAMPTEIRPVRASAEWEWQAQAACWSADAGLFFHPDKERSLVR